MLCESQRLRPCDKKGLPTKLPTAQVQRFCRRVAGCVENQGVWGAGQKRKVSERRARAHFKTGAFNHSATHPSFSRSPAYFGVISPRQQRLNSGRE